MAGTRQQRDLFQILGDHEKSIQANKLALGRSKALSTLTDVDLTGEADGHFLRRSGGIWVPSTASIEDLSDVDMPTAPVVGSMLRFDGTNWVDVTSKGFSLRRKKTGNTSVSNNTWTTVDFETQEWGESEGYLSWDSVNKRVSIDTSGLFYFEVSVRWASLTDQNRRILALYDGTDYLAETRVTADSGIWPQQISWTHDRTAGTWVDVRVYQDTGAALNVEADSFRSYLYVRHQLG